MKKIMLRVVSLIIVALTVVNMLPMAVFAIEATAPTVENLKLSVSSATAMPGDTVDITVSLANNPGLTGLQFDVSYDSVLELSEITFNSAFGDYVTAPTPYKSPQTITFLSPLNAVNTNGVFATLKFIVSADAGDNYDANITVSYSSDGVLDENMDEIPMTVENGKITVIHGIAGDINADRKVNIKDAILLFRYVAKWDVEIYRGPKPTCTHVEVVIPAVAPTCTKDGLTEGKACSVCNTVLVKQTEVPMLDHKFETEKAEAKYLKNGATCTDKAIYYKSCSVCGAKGTVTFAFGEPLGHKFVDGICSVCGDKDNQPTASKGLDFTSNGDGTCSVSGIGTCTDTEIVIPSVSPDGDKVVAIGEAAFVAKSITSVVIPEGVTYIGAYAFNNCRSLKSVTLPKTLEKIDDSAFRYCSNLNFIIIPASVPVVEKNVFMGCENIYILEP